MRDLRKFMTLVIIFFVLIQVNVYSQDFKNCLLVSETAAPDPNDVIIQAWLGASYNVDVVTGDDVKADLYSEDIFKMYDFIFVSESISSSDIRPLRGAPAPIFTTELWSTKYDVLGWVPTSESNVYFGNTATDDHFIEIFNDDHFLAAGFPAGEVIELVTNSESSSSLTYSVPGVEYIPIAVLASDPTKSIVFGIEAGTTLYNDLDTMDGSLISQNRCAAVGINATANNYITEEGFKLMEAGIKWILGEDTDSAIETGHTVEPANFKLEQNYPNPFNPSTEIAFSLNKQEHVKLSVFNATGQEVTVLADQEMGIGAHTLRFNAALLTTGVYFYKLQAGQFSEVKKMMYLK